MRQFQVIPIKLSLKGNKYAKSRETVSESQLTSPADELLSAGFIKEVFEDVKDIETKEAEEVIPLIPADFEEKKEVFEDVKKEIKDIKKPFKRK